MTRLLFAATVLGAVLVAAGVAWVYPPAGVIVAGVELAAVGLLTDDGEKPDAAA